jgi:anti-sigma regulatory factor (Ser/Thr protein kinase)
MSILLRERIKAQKAERLISAVERVTQRAVAKRSRKQLRNCMIELNGRFALENDRLLIQALVDYVQHTMAGMGLGDNVERIRVSEALEEALLNAMYHGNLEVSQDDLNRVRTELDDRMLDQLVKERCKDARLRERRILVVTDMRRGEVRFVVRDEGAGFDTALVARRSPSDSIACGKCRGTTLIQSLMDEVTFNADGNELVMRKCMKTASRNRPEELETPMNSL